MIEPVGMLPECPAAPRSGFLDDPVVRCSLEEKHTGSELVKTVIVCTRCGWIDFTSLDRWVEHAIKSRLDKAAQAVAMAASGEPFAFVQYPDNPLTIQAAISQALGAAAMCWTEEPTGHINGQRAEQIYRNLLLFVKEWKQLQ